MPIGALSTVRVRRVPRQSDERQEPGGEDDDRKNERSPRPGCAALRGRFFLRRDAVCLCARLRRRRPAACRLRPARCGRGTGGLHCAARQRGHPRAGALPRPPDCDGQRDFRRRSFTNGTRRAGRGRTARRTLPGNRKRRRSRRYDPARFSAFRPARPVRKRSGRNRRLSGSPTGGRPES